MDLQLTETSEGTFRHVAPRPWGRLALRSVRGIGTGDAPWEHRNGLEPEDFRNFVRGNHMWRYEYLGWSQSWPFSGISEPACLENKPKMEFQPQQSHAYLHCFGLSIVSILYNFVVARCWKGRLLEFHLGSLFPFALCNFTVCFSSGGPHSRGTHFASSTNCGYIN